MDLLKTNKIRGPSHICQIQWLSKTMEVKWQQPQDKRTEDLYFSAFLVWAKNNLNRIVSEHLQAGREPLLVEIILVEEKVTRWWSDHTWTLQQLQHKILRELVVVPVV
jgi:hypothetical protein